MTIAEIRAAFVEWRDVDIDAEPFTHEQFWADMTAALKPGWCILHGLKEPCWKCNAPHADGEVSR